MTLDRGPRIADACSWITAAESVLGWATGTTATAWLGAGQTASADPIADDPVAQAAGAYVTSTARDGTSMGWGDGEGWPQSHRPDAPFDPDHAFLGDDEAQP